MKLRFLSWNVRGANDSSKRKVMKAIDQESKGGFVLSPGDQNSGLCQRGWLRNVEDGLVWMFTGVYGPFFEAGGRGLREVFGRLEANKNSAFNKWSSGTGWKVRGACLKGKLS
ncbi:hypothetical protein CK203_035393 [Vitis vinifera]|uniref:Uncharacterized protein n=1 Tax=Vitis vinifera TaxID=29760 RepID=A0A438I3S2_VITVI|nr:hypothetical protein CK203_035393 [Vitis vinifera]